VRREIIRTLLERWHEEEAHRYLEDRHNIDADLFQHIQWRSLKFALNKFTHHRRATAVKAIHRHLPTQAKLFNQGRTTMSALCPRCMTCSETNAHIYSCSNVEASNQRGKDWGELQKQLTAIRTSTLIQRAWATHLRPLLALPPTPDVLDAVTIETHDEVSFYLQAAIDAQERVGWDKLLLGIGVSMWRTVQHLIDMNNPKPPNRSASDWMDRAVHQLLKFSLRCWKSRNVSIHGASVKESHKISLDRARDRIKSIYVDPPPLAPQFRPITEVPLAQRLRLWLPAAEHWLALIEHQVKVSAHNLKVLLRQHRPIPEHITHMEKVRRSQIAQRRASNMSPSRARSFRVQQEVKAMHMRLYRSIPSMSSCHGTSGPRPVHAYVAALGTHLIAATRRDCHVLYITFPKSSCRRRGA